MTSSPQRAEQASPVRVEPLSAPCNSFRILIVGWNLHVIRCLADPIEEATGFEFVHLIDPTLDRRDVPRPRPGFRFFRDDIADATMPAPDRALLASLERPSVPTIHNMIMGDRVLRNLDYQDALSWATFVARRVEEVCEELRPSALIGGFDSLHSAVACGVARKLEIPWFALNFTSIPLGMSGFCTAMTPESSFSCLPPAGIDELAERTLTEFESQRVTVPAYLSANSAVAVLKRLPAHLAVAGRVARRIFTGRFDRYTEYPLRRLASDYIRKRANLLRLPQDSFVETPPEAPFLFIGLHMQPESSIDVWAPFFSDQLAVVESIARSMPPTHQLLVKLHKSDADNYSPRELERFTSMPGVRIVSPFAQSRAFIEQAALILAIQGNIALEAGLLGRPVLLFGDSKFTDLPSVTKVKRVTDLPVQIRAKLDEARPTREAIVKGFATYLSHYAPGCYNNWDIAPGPDEIRALADHFVALRRFLRNRNTTAPERAEHTGLSV